MRRRRAEFPPPYPNGWTRVCSAEDVAGDRVHSISALGQEMVAFRGEDGKVGVLDAYCPHLGAHLGEGGTVRDGCLVCPFHGWKFNPSGKVVEIPYSAKEVPERAKTKVYESREILGVVFIWFHADGLPPQWELQCHQDVSGEASSGSRYYYATMRCMQFDQHVCEMAMNGADHYHFQTLHREMPLPFFNKFVTGFHKVSAAFFDDAMNQGAPGEHVYYFTEKMETLHLFGMIPLPVGWLLRRITTKVTFEGPTIVHFRVSTPLGTMRMIKTLLPVSPFNLHVEARWYGEEGTPRIFVNLMAVIGGFALNQDRQVWQNKLWRRKMMWVSGDGPFPAFQRWYNQFYSESSAKVSDAYDW
eukprot:TRINITY_DN28995_c0_g1_i2.p1 TRINITY_DN28995_c0_g1~~TRINITY_DN28995_c0_g1_i2.p1  ORF type:complete len:358 (+),score=55.42 TRINITY_DN28995_c0_g1_i2:191-1264(+)